VEETIKLWGFVILVASNVVAVVVMLTTMKNKLTFLTELFQSSCVEAKEQVRRQDALHAQHFAHAANTGIHQESMSKETISVHFASMESSIRTLSSQFEKHSTEDMEVFKEINSHLSALRESGVIDRRKTPR